MLTRSNKQFGASLIELMIGIGITGILASIAVPSFITWINSTKIRTAAESIQNGLQLARAEAIKRNTNIRFVLTDTASSWTFGCASPSSTCPTTIESRTASSENTNSVSLTATQTGIGFSSLGRQTSTTNNDSSTTANPPINISISVSNPSAGTCYASGGDMRCLDIKITSAGQIRMCDPALPSSNPRGC